MPATYTLIASNTLSSSAASVTFSSIPATYTDLVLRWSGRCSIALQYEDVRIRLNGSSATTYSGTAMDALSTSARSYRYTNATELYSITSGDTGTSNTFSSNEIYIPSYTVSQNKPIAIFDAQENNTTNLNRVYAFAGLWRDTSAITSIALSPYGGSNWLAGSSFFLYGIKNS